MRMAREGEGAGVKAVEQIGVEAASRAILRQQPAQHRLFADIGGKDAAVVATRLPFGRRRQFDQAEDFGRRGRQDEIGITEFDHRRVDVCKGDVGREQHHRFGGLVQDRARLPIEGEQGAIGQIQAKTAHRIGVGRHVAGGDVDGIVGHDNPRDRGDALDFAGQGKLRGIGGKGGCGDAELRNGDGIGPGVGGIDQRVAPGVGDDNGDGHGEPFRRRWR